MEPFIGRGRASLAGTPASVRATPLTSAIERKRLVPADSGPGVPVHARMRLEARSYSIVKTG
jgi:hypothetical protein